MRFYEAVRAEHCGEVASHGVSITEHHFPTKLLCLTFSRPISKGHWKSACREWTHNCGRTARAGAYTALRGTLPCQRPNLKSCENCLPIRSEVNFPFASLLLLLRPLKIWMSPRLASNRPNPRLTAPKPRKNKVVRSFWICCARLMLQTSSCVSWGFRTRTWLAHEHAVRRHPRVSIMNTSFPQMRTPPIRPCPRPANFAHDDAHAMVQASAPDSSMMTIVGSAFRA